MSSNPRRRLRGLRHIRTHGALGATREESYKLYLRLSSVEMERTRLHNERASLIERLRDVEVRLVELGQEAADLSAVLGEGRERTAPAQADPAERHSCAQPDSQPEPAAPADSPWLKLRY